MSLSNLICVSIVALAIISVDAATKVEKRSTCRQTSILQDFDLKRFSGHWYIFSRHHHDFEAGCDCYTSDVIALSATSLQVSNCCQMTHISNETQTCNVGVNNARLANPDKNDASFLYTRTGGRCLKLLFVVFSSE